VNVLTPDAAPYEQFLLDLFFRSPENNCRIIFRGSITSFYYG